MTGPVTLGDLIRQGKLLRCYCRHCGRQRDVDPAMIPLPAETPVPDVGAHMRCTLCGEQKVHTAPELYPGGVEAVRNRHRDPND